MQVKFQKQILFPEIIWKRPVHSYKKGAGNTLLVAGSRGKENIPLQILEAAHRSGQDTVILAFPISLKDVYSGIIPDGGALPLAETPSGSLSLKSLGSLREYASDSDLTVIGPGISQNAETLQLVWEAAFAINKNLVIASSAVDAIVKGFDIIREKGYDPKDFASRRSLQGLKTILVLETKEVLSLLKIMGDNLGAEDFERKKREYLSALSSNLGWIIVHLDHELTVADGPDVVVTASECALNYKNALIGILLAFLSQNPKAAFKATVTGAYVYGLAKNLAWQNRQGEQPLVSDVIKRINRALLEAESTLSW